MTDAGTWLEELLAALERHSQLLQANTAAVRGALRLEPADVIGPERARVHAELARQLEAAERIGKRLEELRAALARAVDLRTLPEAQPDEHQSTDP